MAIYESNQTGLAPRPALDAPGSALARGALRSGKSPVSVYLASLAPSSRRPMRHCLRRLARMASGERRNEDDCPWGELRYEHTQALRSRLAAELGAHTYANLHLCALRGVLKEAWRLGQMSSEDYMRARDVQGVRGHRLPRGRHVPAGEANAIFASLAGGASGNVTHARDAALVGALHGAGLRRAEACALELRHLDLEAGTLVVLGKGNKQRLMPLPEGTAAALKAWLHVRGDWPGALFVPVTKSGKMPRRHMTESAVYDIIRRVGLKAAVKKFAPHDLRRTYVTQLFEAGVDGGTIQKLAGHAKFETTLKYDRRDDKSKKRAVELLHVPYRP